VGAALTRGDRRTDITKLTGALHDYSAPSENVSLFNQLIIYLSFISRRY